MDEGTYPIVRVLVNVNEGGRVVDVAVVDIAVVDIAVVAVVDIAVAVAVLPLL